MSTFRAFVCEALGVDSYCYAPRLTAALKERYGAVLTPAKALHMTRRYLATGGDPGECSPRDLDALGWRQVWVAPA